MDRLVHVCAAHGYELREIAAYEAWIRHCGGPYADWIDTRGLSDEQVVMDPGWDREMTRKLVGLGLSWWHARIAVGVIAEERQTADLQGYARGYNNGIHDATKKIIQGATA